MAWKHPLPVSASTACLSFRVGVGVVSPGKGHPVRASTTSTPLPPRPLPPLHYPGPILPHLGVIGVDERAAEHRHVGLTRRNDLGGGKVPGGNEGFRYSISTRSGPIAKRHTHAERFPGQEGVWCS
jgi:hypothetical protein